MKRLGGIILVVIAIVLITFGVIFLIGSGGKGVLVLAALAMLAVGAGCVVWAIRVFGRLARLDPKQLTTDTVRLAKRFGGEITAAQVQAEFDVPGRLAAQVLEKLRSEGACVVERHADREVYVFKSLIPSKALKRCAYCGSEYSVKDARRDCPNCGASLEIVKE